MDNPTVPVAPLADATPAPAPDPTPKPARQRTRKPARQALAPADVHIDTMRAHGLTYHGPADRVFLPPGVASPVPAETLDGPTAAYHVPTRAALLWLLDRGFRLADPPAAEEG